MNINAIGAIARQELTINIRNKWTMIFAAVFGVLIVSISYFGIRAEGYSGMESFTRTSASLLNLILYIVPLIALTMGTLTFTGATGSDELLFSQPVGRSAIQLGRLLGVFFSISLSTLLGFVLAGIVMIRQNGGEGILQYFCIVALSLLLTLSFLSISLLIATSSNRKPRAFGIALCSWFFFVLFYDLLALGMSLALRGQASNQFLFISLFGNPVDMVRVASLIILENTAIFGAAGAALVRFLGGSALSIVALVGTLGVWIAAPILISQRLLKRQDI